MGDAVLEHANYEVNQLVYDHNNTLCRITYIEKDALIDKHKRDYSIARISLINNEGKEFATASAILNTLKPLQIIDHCLLTPTGEKK